LIIGVLALQGDFKLHQRILNILNVKNILVKDISSLEQTSALIIPGGESTTIYKLLCKSKLYNKLIDYSKNCNIYGSCAGSILMSSKINDSIIKPLNLIDVEVFRNAWGRQIDSFTDSFYLSFSKKVFKGFFIRAPKFKILSNKAKILSNISNEPILVKQGIHLISSFHPEIGIDTRVHEYFINMVKNKNE
tara:strand:+ start:116 stop:688 length:573 start_codon:yes stop_codon:yes gene_type:complete